MHHRSKGCLRKLSLLLVSTNKTLLLEQKGRWVDSDNVRFRYGLPEKVGGWQSLLTDSIVGVARKQHAFVDTEGNRYVALAQINF